MLQFSMLCPVAMKGYFDAWMEVYEKQYNTRDEYRERLEIFAQNAEMVFQHNRGNPSYTSELIVS